MEIKCQNCGEEIPAENINIQNMVAVCPACNHVFSFEVPRAKVKRRKVKQPKKLMMRDDENSLHMEFRTNFRLDQNETFLTGGILSLVFTFMTILMVVGAITDDVPYFMGFAFGLAALAMYYLVGLTAYNKTQIEVEDDVLEVARRPLRSPFEHENEINLSGVVGFRSEETEVSKREGYDTPRYIVRAVMEEGNTKTVVTDVTDDYAHFIAQRLTEHLENAYGVAQLSELTDYQDEPFITIDDTDHDDSEYPSNGFVNTDMKHNTSSRDA